MEIEGKTKVAGSVGITEIPAVQLKTFSTTTEGSVTVNSVSSRLVRNPKPDRKYLALTNYSGTPCFISLSGSARANAGIYLGANGGAFEITQINLYIGSVTAITSGGTAYISYCEG